MGKKQKNQEKMGKTEKKWKFLENLPKK